MPAPSRPKRKFTRSSAPRPQNDEPLLLFGLHAVEAALNNPARTISRLVATENAARKLNDAITARGIAVETVASRQFDRLLPVDTVHQGICISTEPLEEPSLESLAEAAHDGGPLVILDQVTDPHNVGAVLRSSAVFGASGLIMTRRHSPPLNGTLAKSASGALELIPVAVVQNLAKSLETLKASGLSVLGLAGKADNAIETEPFQNPTALVFGAEGKGLRALTRDTCDRLVRISASGDLASLNVSNAAAVALHVAAGKKAGAD